MKLWKKFKDEYSSLTDKEKSNFGSMMIDALSFIPIVGQGVGFAHSCVEWKNNKPEKVVEKILAETPPSNIDDVQLAYIAYVLKNIFSDAEIVISEYVSQRKEEFIKLVLDKYNESRIDYDNSAEIQVYISKITDIILDNIELIETPESVSKTALKGVADHEERLTKIEKNGADVPLDNDNEFYINKKFNEKLFLEDENSDIDLRTMYVSPRIENRNVKANEYIMSWYNTPNPPCLLIYGEAGIGKTSLVAKIIADAYGITDSDKREYSIPEEKVYAVALHEHKNIFKDLKDDYSPIDDVLCEFFSVKTRRDLKDKLLILDGMDEVLVLVPSFTKQKAEEFVRELTDSDCGLKILITSRKGYFAPEENSDVKIDHVSLSWTEAEVDAWCNLYTQKRNDRIQWCIEFKEKYHNLPEKQDNDKRREILCIPFILYIACNSDVDLDEERTVGKIYDHAFRSIIMRKHSPNRQLKKTDEDKKMRLVHWQYTKELAYQMQFNLDLNLVDDDSSDDEKAKGFRNAQERTIEVLNDEEFRKTHNFHYDVKKSELSTPKYLAVFQFAKSNDAKGISFVHKSVYEYFTAVKLYEDYFAKFNKEYFLEHEKTEESRQQALIELMQSWVEAFRYTKISPEVFRYLIEMERPAFTGNDDDILRPENLPVGKKFDKTSFVKTFEDGVRKDILSRIAMQPAVERYLIAVKPTSKSIYDQFSMAFHNFTWYITGLGFDNSNCSVAKIMCKMANAEQPFYCAGWDLKNANLEHANLFEAIFYKADLCGANLSKSNLKLSSLKGAILKGAFLSDSDLAYSDLTGADLTHANLNRSDLSSAILEITKFKSALLWKANLESSTLRGSNLEYAFLAGADFTNANLKGADLSNADLAEANLSNAYLVSTNFYKADLKDINFDGSVLIKANLQGTKLLRANLANTNLEGADFTGAMFCSEPGYETKVPYDFDIDEHDMIEVDMYGNII